MKILLIAALGALAFIVFVLIVFAVGNWFVSLLRKPRVPSEESVRRYRERLLNPRWAELQEHFNQSIPERIKTLGSSNNSSWSMVIEEMFGGQH